jgi:hypothetical protein
MPTFRNTLTKWHPSHTTVISMWHSEARTSLVVSVAYPGRETRRSTCIGGPYTPGVTLSNTYCPELSLIAAPRQYPTPAVLR